MKYDVVVIGTGFSGSVIARTLADNLNKKILMLEKRKHIAGNMYDELNEKGIRVQMYGPHTFITDHKWLIDYIKRFSKWEPWDVTAKVEIDGCLYSLPFNFTFIREYYEEEYSKALISKLKSAFETKERVTIYELLNSDDDDIVQFGRMLCDKDYYPYSSKQWGIPMEKMDSSVISRVKFALSEDSRYIQQKYQYIPINGFTDFFENMLTHKNIDVFKEVDALQFLKLDSMNHMASFKWEGTMYECPIIFTGPIDELFDCKFGSLPYRSLDIEFKTFPESDYQETPFISYPQTEGYTRIVEYKKLTNQKENKCTTISVEYPEQYEKGKNLPYYPIINDENCRLYNQYRNEVSVYNNLFVCGRLGDYKYYNMDAAIIRALEVEKQIEEYIARDRG